MKVWFPVLANIIFPGAGYIILGKRKHFGYILFASSIVSITALIVQPPEAFSSPLAALAGMTALALYVCAFGYDAYQLAKEE